MAPRGEASPTRPSFGVDRLPAAERRVLVVEDDLATRAFLVDNFTADGLPAVGASGAGEGLRAIEVRQPSLVVLDLGLGDEGGWRCSTACGRPMGWPRGSIQTFR
jgi:ActR/RegA family two-component response regulator